MIFSFLTRRISLLAKRHMMYVAFPWHFRVLDVLNQNALLYAWCRKYSSVPQFSNQSAYFQHLCQTHCAGPIDYLEFGVYQGHSIKEWMQLNQEPESRFFGFDTFEGLPEDFPFFMGGHVKGHFDTKGQAPQTNDARVQFYKGLFQQTLDAFLTSFNPRNKLVIHIDSDLYSSALYVLTRMDQHIMRGAIVMFDDFYSPAHDFRAFRDYTSAYMREYDVLAGACGKFRSAAFFIQESRSKKLP
jgi:O-methyltransferase